MRPMSLGRAGATDRHESATSRPGWLHEIEHDGFR
jgi:hypothetical protein